MTRLTAPAPYDMASAMRTLTDPAAHRGHPAIRQVNWCFLKEARGQPVDLDRLEAMHRILPPAPRQTTLDTLLATMEAVRPRSIARRDQLAAQRTAQEDAQ